MAAKIFTISGASGVGKSSIIQAQLDRLCELVKLITSTATRPARVADLKGEYEYVDDLEFSILETRRELLWTVNVGPYRYGTKISKVDECFQNIKRVGLMILTPDIVPYLKKYVFGKYGLKYGPFAVYSFYILSPTKKILRQRLRQRGENKNDIDWKLKQTEWDKFALKSGAFNEFIRNRDSNILPTSLNVMQRIIDLST